MISDSEHVCNAIFTGKAAHKVKVPPPQKMSRSLYYESQLTFGNAFQGSSVAEADRKEPFELTNSMTRSPFSLQN